MRLKYSEGLIKDGATITGETEEDVFAALGLPCPQPTDREVADRKPVWMAQEKIAGNVARNEASTNP